uniref:(northern house mosquito) hypothetical protein n=1 Tax=Culex pipiens TaxID=7175 RepID=A0A8D8FGM4_CULPI
MTSRRKTSLRAIDARPNRHAASRSSISANKESERKQEVRKRVRLRLFDRSRLAFHSQNCVSFIPSATSGLRARGLALCICLCEQHDPTSVCVTPFCCIPFTGIPSRVLKTSMLYIPKHAHGSGLHESDVESKRIFWHKCLKN